MTGRVPPHDLDIEAALLGSCIHSRRVIDVAAAVLRPADFYHPANAHVFAAILDLYDLPAPVDPVSLAARLDATGLLPTVGGRDRLLQLYGAAPLMPEASVAHYTRVVANRARRRRAIAYADQLAATAYEVDDSGELLQRLSESTAVAGAGTTIVEAPPEASDLILTETEPDWVIPHLLARLEVVLIVAEPGAGKTTLLRQIAARTASGMHPFTAQRIPVRRCISFDFQDPPGPAIRATRDILACAGENYRQTWWVELHQQGIDLTNPRDQAWFEAKVAAVDADLVIAGPLYNAVRGDRYRSKQSEETAELAGRFLMDLLVRRNCALIVEAHAPHGDEMRVRGSKFWEDWAAFGFGLVSDEAEMTMPGRSLKVGRFRGDRETGRQWPSKFVQGRGRWPWDAIGIPDLPPGVAEDDLWRDD